MNNSIGIVLVDDNDLDLMIGERLISVVNPGVKVETFNCGDELFDWLSGKDHACIAKKVIFFIDIYMPKVNGFMVAEKASKILKAKGCDAECYLLSATIDDSDLRKIKDHPLIAGFIGKPITKEVLFSVVENFSLA